MPKAAAEHAKELPVPPAEIGRKELDKGDTPCPNPDASLAKGVEKDKVNAAFLEFCLGGPAAVLEVEVQRTINESMEEAPGFAAAVEVEVHSTTEVVEEAPGTNGSEKETQMNSSFSDDGDEGVDDLEDMFDFDPARLAKLVENGAGVKELTEHLQEEYAGALEERLCQNEKERIKPHLLEEVVTGEAMGDVASLMTPTVTPTGAAKPLADLENQDGTCRSSVEERKRRSLAIQHRPSAAQRGEAAVQIMESFGRRSLANVEGASPEEQEQLADAVAQAVRRASNRHRRSVTKAAEVLEEVAEASDIPLEKWSEQKIDSQVELIQSAMDEAYKRHTHSITEAVQSVTSGAKVQEKPSNTDSANVQDRISKAVAAAYERRGADNSWYPQDWPQEHWQWHGQWTHGQATSERMHGEAEQWQWHGEEWSSCEAAWQEQSWQGQDLGQWSGEYQEAIPDFENAVQEWHEARLQQWQTTEQDQHVPPGFEKGAPPGFESGLRAPWRYGSA